jgi:transcriptional regulator with XRE-family HTH domain
MSNIMAGRQLRAARILAGLTQKQLAQAVGVHERAARYWELKGDKPPSSPVRTHESACRTWLDR